jgi:hypothetical protein
MKRRTYLTLAVGLALFGSILTRTTSLRNAAARRTPRSGELQRAGTQPNEVKARVVTAFGHLPLHF